MSIQRDFITNRSWLSIFPELIPQEELEPLALETNSYPEKFEPKTRASSGGNVRVSTLSIGNLHNHGELFVNFLRARKKVFISQAGWDLP